MCVFCEIVCGTGRHYKVHEDELTVSFLDLFPASLGHTLIIPKEHHDDIFTMPSGLLAHIGELSGAMAKAVQIATDAKGISLHQMNRAEAGQTVFHYHTHVIPHHGGDAFQIHGREMGKQQAMEQMAAKVAAELQKIL